MEPKKTSHVQKADTAKTTSWGNVAAWYDDTVEEEGSYQQTVILPNLLRLMELSRGEKVLDLACGQGFFSRAFHGAGADVIGVDISKELVDIARAKSPKAIGLHVAPAHALPFLNAQGIDKATIVLALQNIENMQETLAECARILKPKGKLYLVLNHPAFRIPKESSWGFSAEGGPASPGDEKTTGVQYRRIDRYLSNSRTEIVMHPGESGSEKTISFHRPLQVYAKAFFKSGFVIRRMEEWNSNKKSEAGPRAAAENRSRAEIPLFLALELEKI